MLTRQKYTRLRKNSSWQGITLKANVFNIILWDVLNYNKKTGRFGSFSHVGRSPLPPFGNFGLLIPFFFAILWQSHGSGRRKKRACKKEEETGYPIFWEGMQKRIRRKGFPILWESWLIGPRLFRPEPYSACVSSRLCEFSFIVQGVPYLEIATRT